MGCSSTVYFGGLTSIHHASSVAGGCLVAEHLRVHQPSLAAQSPPWHSADLNLLLHTEPSCSAQPLAYWSCPADQKFKEVIRFYEPIVRAHIDDLLSVTAIVLANLCVSYIMTSQNEEAEALMRKVEQEEELQAQRVRGLPGGGSVRQPAGHCQSDWWQPQHVQKCSWRCWQGILGSAVRPAVYERRRLEAGGLSTGPACCRQQAVDMPPGRQQERRM